MSSNSSRGLYSFFPFCRSLCLSSLRIARLSIAFKPWPSFPSPFPSPTLQNHLCSPFILFVPNLRSFLLFHCCRSSLSLSPLTFPPLSTPFFSFIPSFVHPFLIFSHDLSSFPPSIIRQIRTTQGTRIFQRATTPSPCASPDIQAATLSLNSTRRDGSSRDGENRAYVSPRLVESRLPRRNESRVSLSEVSVAEIAEENDSMCYNMVERLKNEMVDKAIESQVTFQGSKEAGCVATSEPNSVASSPSTPKRRVSLSDVLNDLNARTRSPSPLIPEK